MSGPLSDIPDGTTTHVQVPYACLPAEERPNKTPIFISGVRALVAWLRASCPGGLMAQQKAEKLMVVPTTANGYRAAVRALRSLDGSEGIFFHTFTLAEDRCVRNLVKNLGRGVPESVVREELEALSFISRLSCNSVPAVASRTQPRTDLSPPTSLYPWRGA